MASGTNPSSSSSSLSPVVSPPSCCAAFKASIAAMSSSSRFDLRPRCFERAFNSASSSSMVGWASACVSIGASLFSSAAGMLLASGISASAGSASAIAGFCAPSATALKRGSGSDVAFLFFFVSKFSPSLPLTEYTWSVSFLIMRVRFLF